MTESMNLDSSDIVGTLAEFESLDTIEAINTILNHDVEKQVIKSDVNLIPHFSENVIQIKEEVIEMEPHKEIEETELMEETIAYDISDNTGIENVEMAHHNESSDEIQNDNIFIQRLHIDENEYIIPDTVPQGTYNNDSESEKEFDDIDGIMSESAVPDNTIMDDSEVTTIIESESDKILNDAAEEMDTDGLVQDDSKEEINIGSAVVPSGVYVVNASGTLTPTLSQPVIANNIIPNKDTPQRLTRVVLPKSDLPPAQALRIVAPQNKVKTFTFEEAKQMGLINFNLPSNKGGISKLVLPKKTVTVVKSPTKILPAPPNLSKTQKLLIRNPGCNVKAGTFIASPTSSGTTGVFRIPAAQATQFHLPAGNKQVQYVKLLGGKLGTTTILPVSAISSKPFPLTFTSLLNAQPATTTFKVVPISSQQQATPVVTSAVVTSNAPRILIPAPAPSTQDINTQQQQQISNQPTIVTAPVATTNPISQNTSTNVVMVHQGLFQQVTKEKTVSSPHTTNSTKSSAVCNGKRTSTTPPCLKVQEEVVIKTEIIKQEQEESFVETNGIRPRKPCNCTKSMCLKLYCDCFANGEFCHQCNCTTCYNNLSHEEERQRAIKSCLERNPTAFRPKIGKTYVGSEERRHNKGCNCRRSGCLKNYCECYEAKIPCSKNCKCVGCKNTENFIKRGIIGTIEEESFSMKDKSENIFSRSQSDLHLITSHRQVLNLSPQLVEATCQCLMAQVDGWSRSNNRNDIEYAQTLVIEELGRCLSQLIDCVNRSISQVPAGS